MIGEFIFELNPVDRKEEEEEEESVEVGQTKGRMHLNMNQDVRLNEV